MIGQSVCILQQEKSANPPINKIDDEELFIYVTAEVLKLVSSGNETARRIIKAAKNRMIADKMSGIQEVKHFE